MVSQPSLLGHFLSFVVQKLFSHPFIVSQKQLFSVQMYIQCGLRREGVQCLSTLPSSWTSPPLLVWKEWSCVGEKPYHSTLSYRFIVSQTFVVIRTAYFIFSSSQ